MQIAGISSGRVLPYTNQSIWVCCKFEGCTWSITGMKHQTKYSQISKSPAESSPNLHFLPMPSLAESTPNLWKWAFCACLTNQLFQTHRSLAVLTSIIPNPEVFFSSICSLTGRWRDAKNHKNDGWSKDWCKLWTIQWTNARVTSQTTGTSLLQVEWITWHFRTRPR